MATTDKTYPSVSVFGRHLAVQAKPGSAARKSLLLAMSLAALSIFVLATGGFTSPYDLTSAALIFCCSYMVAVRGGQRSFVLGTSRGAAKQATFEGNLGLIYAVLATSAAIVIAIEIVQRTLL